jgi:LysM repeat protein
MAALQMIPPDHRDAWRMHLVGDSETLAGIAKRYSVSPSSIASTNHLASPQAEAGDHLLIPAVLRAEPPAKGPAVRTAAHRRTGGSKTTPAKTKTSVKSSAKAPVIVARTQTQ